jgi:hypothetical protein
MPTQDPISNVNINRPISNQAGSISCLGSLLPTSVTAYNNRDLIPNGYIDEVGTPSRYIQSPYLRLGNMSVFDKMYTTLLPSDRIYVEFWYSVSSKTTGTRIQDQGNILGFGALGGGAGSSLINALGISRIGDIEPIKSDWTYHICEGETKINRKFVLQASDFVEIDNQKYARITLPDYVIGVLGVTYSPISFVTPSTPITDDQRAEVAQKTPDEIYKALGFLKSPSQLTDTEIRIILGIPTQIDELGSLGNPSGRLKAWPHTYEGGIAAEYTNYSFYSDENFFYQVDRDTRKNLFRSDNESRVLSAANQNAGFTNAYNRRSADSHSYTNKSIDDITDKAILIKIQGKYKKYDTQKKTTESVSVTLKAGDTVYVSYVGGEPILRQGIETDMRFFLFQTDYVNVLPPNDYVKTWNFKKYKFRLPKNKDFLKVTLYDLQKDYATIKKINDAEAAYQATNNKAYQDDKTALEAQLTSFEVEGQRLCETKAANGVVGRPFILGCYFIDSRGFCSCDFSKNDEVKVLVPYADIRDKQTFNAILSQIQKEVGPAYDANGEIVIDTAKSALFDDFYFDVDEFINTLYTDNEKFGYERRLANSIKQFKAPTIQVEKVTTSDGLRKITYQLVPNTGSCYRLDLVRASLENKFNLSAFELFTYNTTAADSVSLIQEWATRLDLYGSKFEYVTVNGKPSNLACNPSFTYDVGYASKGTVTSDALMRTPEIIPDKKLSTKARIYVETFQQYNPLRKNGGIWVGTKPFAFPNFSVATDKFNNYACVAYTDPLTNVLKYRIFDNNVVLQELRLLSTDAYQKDVGLPQTGNALPTIDFTDQASTDSSGNTVSKNSANHTYDKNLQPPGYDKILGDRPGYFNGKEVYLSIGGTLTGFSETQKAVSRKYVKNPFYLLKTTSADIDLRNKIVFADGLEDYFINVDKFDLTGIRTDGNGNTASVYIGQITIKGTLIFGPYTYSLYTNSESGSTYTPVADDSFSYAEDRFISLVFPDSNKVIDGISIDLLDGQDMVNKYKKARFEITVDMDYTLLKPFQMRQRPCVFIDNLEIICNDYLYEDEYNIRKIETQKVSTCFDASQNLYIFYEDYKARDGLLERNNNKYDGSSITGLKGPGFSEKVEKEISCIMSPNLGASWYDFKAVVRTKYNEIVASPYVYGDFDSNILHLFYTINSNLMHKRIDTTAFNSSDASMGYIRPLLLNETTPPNYGLYHFSQNGISMRAATSNVVIGNTLGKYLSSELEISDKRQAAGYPDIRIRIAGDAYNLDTGFADVDFIAYRDRTGQFNIMYALNGKLYQRKSSNDGDSWFTAVQDLYIHKNVVSQEYRLISKFGYGYDINSDTVYFTYLCDDMLFMRSFTGQTYIVDQTVGATRPTNLEKSLDPDSVYTAPMFIAGLIPDELVPYMSSGGNHFIFPYYYSSEWRKFADKNNPVYALSDFQCLGYPLSNGLMRFFYIDYYGNLQGFTLNNKKPILDVIYHK